MGQTHRHREQACGCQGERQGVINWEFGLSRCKVLYIERTNNQVLLYTTGNYMLYPVINHNGKEHQEEYIRIIGSLCCTAEINTF